MLNRHTDIHTYVYIHKVNSIVFTNQISHSLRTLRRTSLHLIHFHVLARTITKQIRKEATPTTATASAATSTGAAAAAAAAASTPGNERRSWDVDHRVDPDPVPGRRHSPVATVVVGPGLRARAPTLPEALGRVEIVSSRLAPGKLARRGGLAAAADTAAPAYT